MSWLWIILRYLFPGDPIRQVAEAMRHRVLQLVHVSQDEATLAELLINPQLRLQLELLILDAEDSLRLWIAMRGCQIARIRPGLPHKRSTPHLTHAKSLPELLARIAALVIACTEMEARAQAHADKLKRLRDADPLRIRTSCGPHRDDAARRATSPAFRLRSSSFGGQVGEGGRSSTGKAGGGGMRSMTVGAARRADAASTQGPPHSIAGATP